MTHVSQSFSPCSIWGELHFHSVSVICSAKRSNLLKPDLQSNNSVSYNMSRVTERFNPRRGVVLISLKYFPSASFHQLSWRTVSKSLRLLRLFFGHLCMSAVFFWPLKYGWCLSFHPDLTDHVIRECKTSWNLPDMLGDYRRQGVRVCVCLCVCERECVCVFTLMEWHNPLHHWNNPLPLIWNDTISKHRSFNASAVCTRGWTLLWNSLLLETDQRTVCFCSMFNTLCSHLCLM